MWQNHILLMRDADFLKAELFSEVGCHFHLLVGHIARRRSDWLTANSDNAVSGLFVRPCVHTRPTRKCSILGFGLFKSRRCLRQGFKVWCSEVSADPVDLCLRQNNLLSIFLSFKLSFDELCKFVRTGLIDQDFDAFF